ncbi:hypothetical protein JDN41_11430, partial [Rhodomicrobium udaipurense]
MSAWSDQIEADLKWREAEIASLKLLAASADHASDRQRAVLRALWAMLYAHYEGFCLFCWNLMLDAIEKEACAIEDLNENFAKLAMADAFNKLRSDLSSDRIWIFIRNEFQTHLKTAVKFEKRLETRSNLWPNLAVENNRAIGLDCNLFEENAALIKGLVSRRNEIAHGKKMVIKDLKEYQSYENATLLVMHELA